MEKKLIIKEKIRDFLKKENFFVVDRDKFYHLVGMPDSFSSVFIKPMFKRCDGNNIIQVLNDKVSYYCLNTPYNYNSWRCVESKTYNSKKELIEIIKNLSGESKANLWLD